VGKKILSLPKWLQACIFLLFAGGFSLLAFQVVTTTQTTDPQTGMPVWGTPATEGENFDPVLTGVIVVSFVIFNAIKKKLFPEKHIPTNEPKSSAHPAPSKNCGSVCI
jgi:hypothetical protein